MSESGLNNQDLRPAGAALALKAVRFSPSVTLYLYAAAMFFSALLLFMVQPMFAKMTLPRLGGSPAVWSVAMCFFQVTLLAGYAYAHLLTKLTRPGWRVGAHVAALSIAALTLPLGVAAGWERAPQSGVELWVFALFAVSIGLPFLTLSANAPTLQAWFSRTGHPHAADPYFLYGASNLGSLLALLAYPVLIEPQLSLGDQSLYWSLGFAALILGVGVCGLTMLSAPEQTAGAAQGAAAAPVDDRAAPVWGERLSWIGLAFAPSALLVAVTSHISTDVSSAPFLWVIPLALFLLTFVIVFQKRPVIGQRAMLALQPAAAALMLLLIMLEPGPHWLLSLSAHLGGFFILAMVCHGALVARRPSARHLTEFFLFMSLGGALGGVFTSLVAPHVFSTIVEFPLLILATLLARPGLRQANWRQALCWVVAAPAVIAAGYAAQVAMGHWSAGYEFWAAIGAVALLCAAGRWGGSGLTRGVAAAAALLLIIAVSAKTATSEQSYRGFFGVVKIADTPDGAHRMMKHGTTLHGAQRLSAEGLVPEPLTYYHAGAPLADAIAAAREVGATGKVGVVGLGAGSLACYRRPGERWTFFEIDPIVVRLAQDPNSFSFLADCAPEAEIVLGDARVTLADQPDSAFDLLLLDAFSSDAVPIHLLTVEALRGYFAKLSTEGVLAIHISNRNVDLGPVVAALAREEGLAALHRWSYSDDAMMAELKTASRVVALARRPEHLASLAAKPGWAAPAPSDWPAWRDDYANVLQAILAGADMKRPDAAAANEAERR